MITGVQPKLLVSFDENGNMQLDPLQAELLGIVENEFNWKLIRERDGLTKQSKKIMCVEFKEYGIFKVFCYEAGVYRFVLMSEF